MKLIYILLFVVTLMPKATNAQSLKLSVGLLNMGPLVHESVRHVRFGNGGFARYLSVAATDGTFSARLLYAPDRMYIWRSTGKIDRWHHRVYGGRSEAVGWACLTLGPRWRYGSIGFGGCTWLGMREQYFGAGLAAVPTLDLRVQYSLRSVGIECGTMPAYVDNASWTVLRKVAGLEDSHAQTWQVTSQPFIWPGYCGLSVGVDF